jgi:hypothetical protein
VRRNAFPLAARLATPLAAAALTAGCALTLSGCGSSSASPASASGNASQNNANLTQAQLLDRLTTALAGATAVHIKGTLAQAGASVGIDMQVNKSGTAQGTIVNNGAPIPLISVGGTLYIQLTQSYVNTIKASMPSSIANAQLATVFVVGKWLKAPASGSITQDVAGIVSWNQLTARWSAASGDSFEYKDTTTLNGQQVADYEDVSKLNGMTDTGVVSLPLTGAALPIQVAEKSGTTGTATFSWNQPTTVTAPPASEVVSLPSGVGNIG